MATADAAMTAVTSAATTEAARAERPRWSPPPAAPTVPPELLVRPRPAELLGAAARDWAAIAACSVAMTIAPRALYPVLALLVAGRLHALAALAHDAAHLGRRLRGPAFLALEILAGWPIGTTLPAMRAHHLRHHRDSNLPSDPYAKPWLDGGGRWRYLPAALVLMALYPAWVARTIVGAAAAMVPALRPAYVRLLLVRPDARPLGARELRICLHAEIRFTLALAALAAATCAWPEALLVHYFVPLALTFALNAFRNLAEHTRDRARDRSAASVRATTRDVGAGWLARLLVAPHNLGYHVVHHLHPEVGHGALARLDAWYAANDPGHRPGDGGGR
jgi:fatty acid desaturase